MQINWLPQNICDSIDQTTRNFIWRDHNNKGIHLVNWKTVASPKKDGGLGIRAAREANICLLGKLVWNMVQKTNKLWVNLLSNNYSSGQNFLHSATAHRSSSPSWSSIIRAKNVLKSGYSWRPGSGNSSFWYTNWSSLGMLGTRVPFVDIHDLHLTVKDVFANDGQHIQSLYTILPPDITEVINNTKFNFNAAIDDAYIWSHNNNGVYTTKSGYNWILSQSETESYSNTPWSWIWRLKIPEKYKFFVWLACHNAVPTLSLLNHRNMATSAICNRCGDHEESFLHCVRDYRFFSIIWHKIGFNSSNFFLSSYVLDWLTKEINCHSSTTFLAGLWWI
jgi:hypothetical protein